VSPLGPSPRPTAAPLWVQLRQHGRKVATATWPGGDGADILINNTVVQPAQPTRVTDYTVPFGAFGGLGAQGFSLTNASFAPDSAVGAALNAAGHFSYSPVLATSSPIETFSCSSAQTATCSTNTATFDVKYAIRVAAIDTTNDGKVNYDTLVFFDATRGITSGPFHAPSTGPAYAKFGGENAPFFFEGSGAVVGTAYFVSALAPDLSVVRFARYSADFIPRNTPVIADVDDINNNIGFWRPQADFRIPERLSPGFTTFPDVEIEAMFEDMVKTFVRYQANIGERAIRNHPDADLVMVYIEQPDGSEHQFLLIDPRQGTNPTDPNSIGANQDPDKVARYAKYIRFAYQTADKAVKQIMDAAGHDTNVIVVSDHGFAPFHTSVSMTNILKNAGIDTSKVAIRTSGPAVNIYVNLQGRELGGTVDAATYNALVTQITNAVKNAADPNPRFNFSLDSGRIFTVVESRPLQCDAGTGLCTSRTIGQDFGDVFALMAPGYNFDGIQSPGVARLGDPAFNAATTALSMPNFYGAHGHDPELPVMSATFIARGPQIREHTTIRRMHNIDVAPTIMQILAVEPRNVDGEVLREILR
jgi:predicted AlkP superfamily pyrophosphatase or phosphodiesterase